MQNKKILVMASLGLMLVLAGMLVISAENENSNTAAVNKSPVLNPAKTNMTYGQCVSLYAKIKNDCYDAVKQIQIDCKNNTADNNTKDCKIVYKDDKAKCKKTFKESKKNICAEIKHNFFETMGSAFK